MLQRLHNTCSQCSLRELCLPCGLSSAELHRVGALVSTRQKIKQNHALYSVNDKFEALYAVYTGFFKTVVPFQNGRDQITDFQMSGELLGMDGIGEGRHTSNAIALEDSEVCVIPFDRLQEISHEVTALQRNLYKIMGYKIAHNQGLMTMLGTMRAEERVAAFLLNLSQRLAARGYSSQEFHLRMRREEIGSYLGLKIETVSRAFSRLQDGGYISMQQKHARIINASGLQDLIQTAGA